jgi:hypothetical protein
MQLEAMEQIDAEPYERANSRKAHRNGYKDRTLKTRVDELTSEKPQFREMPFQTKIFDRYSRVEKALLNSTVESYLQESRPDECRILSLGCRRNLFMSLMAEAIPKRRLPDCFFLKAGPSISEISLGL